MKTATAYVVGAETRGGAITVVRVRCPWCNGIHTHAWSAEDELGRRLAHCGTPGAVYRVVFPTNQENCAMPPPFKLDPNSCILSPAEGRKVKIGFGYIAETSRDVVFLVVDDEQHGSHTVLFTPQLADQIAAEVTAKCAKLSKLRAGEKNGETR